LQGFIPTILHQSPIAQKLYFRHKIIIMATICLDAGHGGASSGAVFGHIRQEKNDNLAMVIAVGRILECRGHRVIYTRQTDIDVGLTERARISNAANANIFVSIHRNGSVNAQANGVENYVRPNATNTEVEFAHRVLNRIVALNVFTNRGVHRGNFTVLNATNAPAQLLEVGFITNAADNARLDNNFNRIVVAIANGIEDCVGRGGGTPPLPPPPPPSGGLSGVVTTAGGNLNVRSAPSAAAQVIGSLPNGTPISVLEERSGFYRINFNNNTGWVSTAFVRISQNAVVTTAGGNLNMRAAPSANAPVVASIPNGTRLTITAMQDGFLRTSFGGREGWVSSSFVTNI
jgi:N-acetylmuramoyl-L-alanine amidase/uncharacterized protein YraI